MKIFQTIQRQYAILGITSTSNESIGKYSFNRRMLLGFILFACTTASQLMYICCVANDFMEYIECVGVISGSIIVFVCFAAIAFKRILLFDNIDKMEKHIDSSKTA